MERKIIDNTCCGAVIVFGQNVRRARVQRNMSIIQLATLSDYDRGCLSKLEYGAQNIRYKTAYALSRALNVPLPILFSRHFSIEMSTEQNSRLTGFSEDDFLLVFVENIKRELHSRNLAQNRIYINKGLNESIISRILRGKETNPTICTLETMAVITNRDLAYLFSRTHDIIEMEDSK